MSKVKIDEDEKKLSAITEESVFYEDTLKLLKKRASRNVLYCDLGRQRDEYTFSPISLIIITVAIGINAYLIIKYGNEVNYAHDIDVFLISTIMNITLYMMGFFLHIMFVNRKLSMQMGGSQIIVNVLFGISIFVAGVLFQSAVRLSNKFAIAPIDYYLFFITIAVGEEVFFRFGLLPTIKTLINYDKRIASVLAILITAGIFMVYHIFVYESTVDLFIVFIVGVMFGIGLELTTPKSLDAPLIAHVLLNIWAGINVINLMFGGF